MSIIKRIISDVRAIGTIAHGNIPCNICGTANCEHTFEDQLKHAENSTLSKILKPKRFNDWRDQL